MISIRVGVAWQREEQVGCLGELHHNQVSPGGTSVAGAPVIHAPSRTTGSGLGSFDLSAFQHPIS